MRPVSVANHHPRLRFNRRDVVRLIRLLDAHHDELRTQGSVLDNDAELSIAFFTDVALARLHNDFLDDPSITDVITFEGNAVFGSAGEICVSADAAVRQVRAGAAPQHGPKHREKVTASEAVARELTLYVVHGWLHLAGYDDLQPAKKRVMRRAEKRAMAVLEREGCIPRFRVTN